MQFLLLKSCFRMNEKLKVETVECAVKDVSTTHGRCENAHSAFVGGPNVAKVDPGGEDGCHKAL